MLVPVITLLIPLVAIVMGVGLAMFGVYLNYRKRKEIFTLYHQERMAAIEKGVDVAPLPDSFFAEDTRVANPRRQLRTGMIWLFVGVVLTVAMYANGMGATALYALVPAAVGLALLLYYFLEGRKALPPLPGPEPETADPNLRRPS